MGRKKLGQWTLWGGNSLPNIVQIAFDHETLCRYDNLKASHHLNCKCTKFLFSYTLWACMLPGWVMLYNIIYIHSGGKRLTCRAPCSANLGPETCCRWLWLLPPHKDSPSPPTSSTNCSWRKSLQDKAYPDDVSRGMPRWQESSVNVTDCHRLCDSFL